MYVTIQRESKNDSYKYDRDVSSIIPTAVFTLGKIVTPYKCTRIYKNVLNC